MELQAPMDQISNLFNPIVINGVKNAAFGVSIIILIQVVARAVVALYQWKYPNSVITYASDSSGTEAIVDEGVPVEAV